MKLLALTLNGTPVQLPGQINTVTNNAGLYGINIIKLGVNLLMFAAILLAFVFVVFGGWKWLISQGDKKKLEEARTTIIWAVVGVFVVAFAFLVVNIIGQFFNVPLIGK